jgi:hypothetical protein
MKVFETTQKPRSSPWGQVDSAHQDAPGIWWVSTPSHGGFILSGARVAAMPAVLKAARGYGGPNAFEEDSEWALVVCSFPEEFPAKVLADAIKTIEHSSKLDFPGFQSAPWVAAAAYAAELTPVTEKDFQAVYEQGVLI